MRLSDIIEDIINQMLKQDGFAEIKRNELADRLNCVPSQINYVLSTRFSLENGYIIESRRGGGGYIKISRIEMNTPSAIMHIVNMVGDCIDFQTVFVILENLKNDGIVTACEEKIILSMMSDNTLAEIPQNKRPKIRAAMLKTSLAVIANNAD